MLRRLIIVAALAAGMCVTAVMTLATPALAKGPSEARITGPGLAGAIVVSGGGEPGQLDTLARLAEQTNLFNVLFGVIGNMPAPVRLRTPPRAASLGPRYTVIYTVPGVTPRPGERFGRIRQELYPFAPGGPVIYTPPGQAGFNRPLEVTGWLRGRTRLARMLAALGVPRPAAVRHTGPGPARQVAAHHAGGQVIGWLVGSAAAVMLAVLAAVGWRIRVRRRPASGRA